MRHYITLDKLARILGTTQTAVADELARGTLKYKFFHKYSDSLCPAGNERNIILKSGNNKFFQKIGTETYPMYVPHTRWRFEYDDHRETEWERLG